MRWLKRATAHRMFGLYNIRIVFVKLIQKITLLILISSFACVGLAQTTGKIAGRVFDTRTGESLPGANVMVVSTSYGAACDDEGDFYIINIPPGKYNLRISMIGYGTAIINDLVVSVNRTARIEVPLELATLELQEVTIVANRISIEKDQTGTVRNISADQMENLPVENLDQVVAMQAGIVKGHIRGGRASEVTYLMDGIMINEVFDNNDKTVSVEKEVVQDLEVITGTFNAEYGRAMSGVINAVTKDGGNELHGSIAGGYGNYYTTHDDIFIGLEPGEYDRNSDNKLNLNGPIIKDRLTFLINYRSQDNFNYLNGIKRFMPANYSDYTSSDSQDWISEQTGDSGYVSMNYNLSRSYLAKVSARVIKSTRMSLLYQQNLDEWQDYDHAWKYDPHGRATNHSDSRLLALQLNTVLSKNLFFDLKLSRLNYYYGWYVAEDPFSSDYVHDAYLSNSGTGFYTGGQQKGHTRRWTENNGIKSDLAWQINKKHLIKTGLQFNQHRLENKWYQITNLYEMLPEQEDSYYIDPESDLRVYPYYEPFIFTESESVISDEYVVEPYEFSAYLQDKLEHQELVLNYGVRFDYFNPNSVYPSQRRNPANQLAFPSNPERMSEELAADAKYQISPRFGLAYQLGNTAVLRFSYGHFMQMPPMYAIYQNRAFIVAPQDYETTMGNAQLNAQKTVQYEVGVWQELLPNLSLEVAVFYRDIFDLLSTKIISTYNQIQYGLYSNKDYGNVMGFELKVDYNMHGLTAFVNYTLQYTKGNADNPTQNFDRAGEERDPITNLIPMSWDQRHTVNATLMYSNDRLGISFTGYYDSGTPFNWEPLSTSRLAGMNLLPNNEYMPATIAVDMSAHYSWNFKGYKLVLSLQTYNLLDQLNDSWVDTQTGRAYTAIIQDSDIASHHSDFNDYYDTIHDPSMYNAPRFAKLNLELSF